MNRSGRDEPVWVTTHICMGIIGGFSLYSYLYLKLAKTPCFSNYLLYFFFYKFGEQEGRTDFSQKQVRVGRCPK
jgi:hypothetical protein